MTKQPVNPPGHSLRGRTPYVPITKRPRLVLPGGARVAVWTIVNVENWSPEGALPRTVLSPPQGGPPLRPDVPNWTWHEYGMRVGFWRFVEVLAARRLKATFALNGTVVELYREACQYGANQPEDQELYGQLFQQRGAQIVAAASIEEQTQV